MKKYPFLFCGFTGLCLEILWTGLHSLLRGDASMKGTTSLLMFPIYGCASLILPVYKKLKKPSGTSARLPLYCRILPGRIYQRFYPAGFSHVPLGLFRSAPSVQRNHPSGLSPGLVSHRIVFRKNTYKIFLKNHSKQYMIGRRDFALPLTEEPF